MIGFGARYAGGCTSGHAISGLSNLQLPSLIAVVGLFIGGLISTFILLPLIFKRAAFRLLVNILHLKIPRVVKGLKYIIVGILFGIVMSKSEAISWFRIQEMFRFQSFHMYGIIGTAVVLGTLITFFIKKYKLRDY